MKSKIFEKSLLLQSGSRLSMTDVSVCNIVDRIVSWGSYKIERIEALFFFKIDFCYIVFLLYYFVRLFSDAQESI